MSNLISAAASAFGRLGGKKGGVARALRLTPSERSRIAKNATAHLTPEQRSHNARLGALVTNKKK